MSPTLRQTRRLGVLVALALCLCACKGAADLLYEPKPEDPLDGYEGSLAQAGINTEMDWGPKQNLLLSEFKTLKEEHSRLQKRLDQILAENQNLKAQIKGESESLQKEKTLRTQSEAETELLRQRRRDLEAKILSLSIEKAKLEQQGLYAKIELLKQTLDQTAPDSIEAAATPPARQ